MFCWLLQCLNHHPAEGDGAVQFIDVLCGMGTIILMSLQFQTPSKSCEMDDELLELLASADALAPLSALQLLPDGPQWPTDGLELDFGAPLAVQATQAAISSRNSDIERKREYRRRKKAETNDLRAQKKLLEARLEAIRARTKQGRSSTTLGWQAIA